MQPSDHSRTRKQPLTFATLTLFGVAALLLGLALIFFAHYHERAYVFLGLGAGGIIGGIAGMVGAASKTKIALSYGVIAFGMMGFTVGLNYLADRYGSDPNQAHGAIVMAVSLVVILAGMVGALFVQPNGGMAVISSILMLGIIASLGVVAMTVGMIYFVVLHSQGHASFLFAGGAVCLIGGIACGIFAQRRARVTLH